MLTDFAFMFLASFAGCAFLVWTKALHIKRTARGHSRSAVQSSHVSPTPRVGGVAIGAALLVGIFVAPSYMDAKFLLFVLSLCPVFAAGLADDLGFDVSPKLRLAAAAVSSLIAVAILQIWIDRIDFPPADYLLSFAPLAIGLTIFSACGVCHAFNLIDGLNGLSAGTAVLVGLGLASIGMLAGDTNFGHLSGLFVAAVAGFLILNFPKGRIFLGDAGAYTLGHTLVWLGIVMLERVPETTPWVLVLLFFWPVADTIFAILRRQIGGRRLDQPDRLHYHQLVMRVLEITVFGRGRRHLTNPVAATCMMPLIAAPIIAGVFLRNEPLAAFLVFSLFFVLFVVSYNLLIALARTYRIRSYADKANMTQ